MSRSWMLLALLVALPGGAAGQGCGVLAPQACGVPTSGGLPAIVEGGTAASTPLERAARAVLPGLLANLQLEPKMFESDEADETGLGFAWAFSRQLSHWQLAQNGPNVTSFQAALESNGNVAFDPDINPRDFLTANLDLGWFGSWGGAQLPANDPLSQQLQREINELLPVVAEIETAELETHPAMRRVLEAITGRMGTQVFVSADARLGYETDQSFDHRQLTYGGRVALDIKPWRRNSALGNLNLLDWPFALTRWLTGMDPRPRVRGAAFPTFIAGIDQVKPDEDSLRAAVGDLDAFTRFVGEVGFRTVAARVPSGLVYASANARIYQELGASAAIEAADLDRFLYFVVALTAPEGLFVSYSTGQLPFDRRDDQVYEIGFRYKF